MNSFDAPPDVSIRGKPPSPKRLSRKMLLTAASCIGALIAFALVSGLSASPKRHLAPSEAVGAAGSLPESIRSAPDQYDAGALPGANLPPLKRDIIWGGHPPPVAQTVDLQPSGDPGLSSGSGATDYAPAKSAGSDQQSIAQKSPILFGSNAEQNEKLGKASFGKGDDGQLDASLKPPRSRFEILAGSIIPAALATALNSDLPGKVIAQVTAPVYDSVSGEHLLIPQGARLLGTYGNGISYGDHRLVLVWNRLILPNGWSIDLGGMQGADPSGASGLKDKTDQHLDRLAGAIGLASIVSVIANEAEDDKKDNFGRSVGDAAAQEAARAGGRIIDREMSVRPTLRIRAGASVRVLVTKDIRMRPYDGQ